MTSSSDTPTERVPATSSTQPQPTLEYVWPEPIPEAAPPVAEPSTRATSADPGPAVVPSRIGAVEAETVAPPRKKGNRLAGLALALLGTVVFAALHLAALTGLRLLLGGVDADPGRLVADLALSPMLLVPAAAFLVGMALIVLVVNRAGWWAYVLGGFLVAVVVAAAALAGEWIAVSGVRYPADRAEIAAFALVPTLAPAVLVAAVLAREVAIWTGAAISGRARSVKRRNAERAAERP